MDRLAIVPDDVDTKALAEEVRALTAQYYELIGPHHHKDRDCHWYVQLDWKYGDGPEISVSHDGYLHQWDATTVGSFREALLHVRARLRTDIADVKSWSLE